MQIEYRVSEPPSLIVPTVWKRNQYEAVQLCVYAETAKATR
jgi:hypothetical protein